ncbi:tetratricopeptide repeat protein [Spirillospora sp. NPDC048824]|uniref:tetratricopeptide repeat protein n=1 Tax=Spirillospora sp. NPDC048824 TaxID=3364526 RepID=UPI00371F8D46
MAEARKGLLAFQEALRALEMQAVAGRKVQGLPHSRREAAREARQFAAQMDDRRIGEWLRRGNGRAPRDPDQVWALVQVWSRWAAKIPGPRERRYWNQLVEEAQAHVPQRPDGIGRPISEWADPHTLEVHPAIENPYDGMPALPAYVRRGHDAALERFVQRAIDASAITVLVGEAATGKTRACWEALSCLPSDWRLWHPIAPSRPQALLKGIPLIGPRTVVWLNDMQHYLLTPGEDLGEQVAAELRVLLRAPERGPVLVLGTIWPRYWTTLTGYTSPHEDPHAQARALLTGTELPIPTLFSRPDLDRARLVAQSDPRLAEAVDLAEDGHLTQYLAGGPALQAIYRTASPPARALMDIAIDARRLGHSPLLPRPLLIDAAPGYLTRPQREMLDQNWLDQAFTYVADHRPCRGARAPLTSIPHTATEEHRTAHFRLADYLEQYGQAQRRTFTAPKTLWDALLTHARGSDLVRLGRQAQQRGLYQYALRFYAAAFESDPTATDAMLWAGDLYSTAGRLEEAVTCYRCAAEGGDVYAWTKAAETLRTAGQINEALTWYERAAADGSRDALTQAADMLLEDGRHADAKALLHRAARSGVAEASRILGETMLRDGRVDEAVRHLQEAAEAGDTISLIRVVGLMREDGSAGEAIRWLQDRQPGGPDHATAMIADLRWHSGDPEEAINLILPLCADNPVRMRTAAKWLASAARTDEAIDLYGRAAEHDDIGALREAVSLLSDRSGTGEAITWLLERASNGNLAALEQAVVLALQVPQTDQVLSWLRTRVDSGDAEALGRLARVLHGAGRTHEAIQAYQDFRGDVGTAGLRHQADLLWRAGWIDQAISCYKAAAENGDTQALGRGAELLRDTGRAHEAIEWLRSRVAAGDGEVALRWSIDLMLQTDQAVETIHWLQSRVEEGDSDALIWTANLLRDTERVDEALAYYLRAAEAGVTPPGSDDSGALALAAMLLNKTGRRDDAARIIRYGIEPGGEAAQPAPLRPQDHQVRTASLGRPTRSSTEA